MRGSNIPTLKTFDSNRSFKDDFVLICSSCKRIKDREGYWRDLDGIWKIADTLYTHGLCPRCSEKYSAQIVELVRARGKKERVSSC